MLRRLTQLSQLRGDSETFNHDVNWIIDRKASEEIADVNGERKAGSQFYYDPNGNLILQEDWLDKDRIGPNDVYVPTIRSDYDSYGNIIRITNANGHAREIAYGRTGRAGKSSSILRAESGRVFTSKS